MYSVIRLGKKSGPSDRKTFWLERGVSEVVYIRADTPSINRDKDDTITPGTGWHIHIGFWKGIWYTPHELLKSKLFGYGIGGKTLKWIDSFLCFRQQRVVVNGVKSDWAPVLSGVPQGTVLGPLLFSLYINDISSDIESEIRLFADDCVCYREIKDEKDTMKLQRDIDRLGSWARK